MSKSNWRLLGAVLVLAALALFAIPVLHPKLNSGQALGLAIVASPATLVAALLCLFS